MYYLEHFINDKLEKTITNDLQLIRKYLIELDDLSTEKLIEIAKIEELRVNNETCKETVSIEKVYLKIPGFSDKFRIIDMPGMTNSSIRDEFFKFINKKCLINIFLIMRNLTQKKVSDVEFIITTNMIISRYPNSLSLLILSKVDALISEKDNANLKKYQDNLEQFLKHYENKGKFLKNCNIHILSCKEALKDIEIYKKGVNKLKDKIIDIHQNHSENQRLIGIINKLRYYSEDFNSKISEKYSFDKDEIEIIYYASQESYYTLKDKITYWLNNDLFSFELFQEKYKDEIKELKDVFTENDKYILKCNYFRRNTYIEDQISHLKDPFQKKIIDQTIKVLTIQSLNKFLDNLPIKLREKVKTILVDKKFIRDKIDDKLELTLNSLIATLIGIAVATGLRFAIGAIIGSIIEEVIVIGTVSLIPVVGWVVGVVLGIGCIVLAMSHYVGIWERANCFKDVIKIFYRYITEKKTDLLNHYVESYKETLDKFCETLKDFKVDSTMNLKIRSIIDNYEVEVTDKSEKSVDNKKLLHHGIEVLQLETNDYEKVKNFLNKFI